MLGTGISDLRQDFQQTDSPQPAFGPPGSLWDNDVSNATTSVASQDGQSFARAADDFLLDDPNCSSGRFRVHRIRLHMVQSDSAPQSFAIEIYHDDGTGQRPNSFAPIVTLTETSQTQLGPFGPFTSLYEAEFVPAQPLALPGGRYWLAGLGTVGGSNFLNFFAASNGAGGQPANALVRVPQAGFPDWTPAEGALGPPSLHFAFAVDGGCQLSASAEEIPVLSGWSAMLLAAGLASAAAWGLRGCGERTSGSSRDRIS